MAERGESCRLPRPNAAYAAALAAMLTLGCTLAELPGLGPLVGPPPEPLVPEAPACGAVRDPPPKRSDPKAAIVGAADYHNHQFANLGFGGRVVWGSSFHERGIEAALSSCGAEGLCFDGREMDICRNLACAVAADPEACRQKCERSRCSTSPPHGHLGLLDPIGAALGQGRGHQVDGFPHFTGWPHWNSFTHQQEYHRWLRRAFDGGLKLIVVLAVTNEVLCKFLGNVHPCDDMTNVDLQLAEARRLERFIDYETDCDAYNNNGWYRIAETPEQARQIIADGAMAVVLGAEVDSLFNCSVGRCDAAYVKKQVEAYRARGVVHLFPVHLFDNAFGGTAAAEDFFNFGNVVVNHDLLRVKDCSAQGYEFRFGKPSEKANEVLHAMASTFGVRYPEYPKMGAHCNARGLTALGKDVLGAMMDAKMVIDVDHMSLATRTAVLRFAKDSGYSRIVSGHSGFIPLYKGHKKAEGQLTKDELERLLELGGLVAPILSQGELDEVGTFRRPGKTSIVNDCGDSAKSFAQAYLYAVDAIQKRPAGGDDLVAVGFGSDINGLAGLPRPRFGPFACGGDGVPQSNKVQYPFVPLHGNVATMDRQQAGYRVFDINVDGFAQMGMFPDFVAELQAIGLTPEELTPLFNSAEKYIRMWEGQTKRATQPATPEP